MKLQSIQAAEQKLMLQTYARNPYLFVSGEGVYLRDENGNDYLDLLSGIGCSALGYRHPAMEAAILKQGTNLIHTSNLFYTEHTAELALRLTEISGMDRVFFCNSGSESWEAALKLARAHAGLLRSEGKSIGTKILALDHSFHGRTMGAVSTTSKDKYREPFNPLIPGVEFVAFNDVADLRAKFLAGTGTDFCAICIEAIQGEGGINPVTQEFFAECRALCDATGALLLVDEIQSGLGRTGKWFAYQHYGIQPDVTTLAKPLAGGIPMGTMLCTEEAARAITPGMHGTTFGGNPFACAVAIAVIDAIREDSEAMLAHIIKVGDYFKSRLQALVGDHPAVKEVRGLGLMLGLELHSTELATETANQMMQARIILNRTSDTVLRFLPPYIVEKQHIDIAVAKLEQL
ncbi:MAG TPA: acetylornithine/succinylornithine family transaminase, partial [Granulicella sp.]|nr:acetylornithine/succinylornithine family transaminase [Granulicella sp.]